MFNVGVDIGGMSIKVGLVDELGAIFAKATFETLAEDTARQVIKKLADFIKHMVTDADLPMDYMAGLGIGVPGSVYKGVVKHSNNLHWDNVPIVEWLAEYLGIPSAIIFAENDANAAIIGEVYFGSCKDKQDAVLITLGTGVGTGIMSGGKLLVGNGACGAEGGHMVINPNGALCTCGRHGCWEVYASATALIRATEEGIATSPDSVLAKMAAEEGKVSGKTAFEAYRAGCKVARRIVKSYIRNVACGVTNLGNILRPEVVAIGGGISKEGEWFCRAIQEQVDAEAYGGEVNPRIHIVIASLGNDAGIIGAAALAMYSLNLQG